MTDVSVIVHVSLCPLNSYLPSVRVFDGKCVFTANGERTRSAGFLDTRSGGQKRGNISAGWNLWLENHLVWAAEYDMERQTKYEDNEL